MKDNSSTPVIERYGDFKESKFGIASNEDLVYIFDILRNKLYSDKIMAVVREYTTNAMDANIENGFSEKPIVVTAPSSMSPEFSVRDFGKGLSEEEIRSVYCMYGRSTKRNSNDFTGQLGLGSKSGFAYGDSFNITSFKDGVKCVYTAYIDESKLGSIAKVSQTKTEEPSGIEISIPVKSADVSVFQDKISSALSFFKVKPLVNGTKIKEIKEIFSGSFWKIIAGEQVKYYDNRKTCVAVMGNIAYPVDKGLVYPSYRHDYYNPKYPTGYGFLATNSVLYFEIGELSISASREELEYTDVVINAIKKKAELAEKELVNLVSSRVSNCKDIMEARLLSSDITNGLSHELGTLVSKDIKWQTKLVTSFISIDSDKGIRADSFRFNNGNSKLNKIEGISSLTIMREDLESGALWLNDDSKNCIVKMRKMALSSPGKIFYLFKAENVLNEDGSVKFQGLDHLDKWIIPLKYFNKISSFVLEKENNKVKTVNRIERGKSKVYILNEGRVKNYGTQSDNWTEIAVNKSEIEVYVELNRFQPVISGVERFSDSIVKIEKASRAFGVVLPTVYGVKTKDIEDLNLDRSKSIENFCLENLKRSSSFINSYSFLRNQNISQKLEIWSDLHFIRFLHRHIDESKNTCSKNSPFSKLIDITSKLSSRNGDYVREVEDINFLIKIPSDFIDKSTEEKISLYAKEVSEKYPLIKQLNDSITPKEVGEVFSNICAYVNAIDKCS